MKVNAYFDKKFYIMYQIPKYSDKYKCTVFMFNTILMFNKVIILIGRMFNILMLNS